MSFLLVLIAVGHIYNDSLVCWRFLACQPHCSSPSGETIDSADSNWARLFLFSMWNIVAPISAIQHRKQGVRRRIPGINKVREIGLDRCGREGMDSCWRVVCELAAVLLAGMGVRSVPSGVDDHDASHPVAYREGEGAV